MRRAYRFVAAALVIAVASAFCLLLYKYDNKYTHDGAQALAGTLAVSETDRESTPLRFLWNGWLFYPDALLDPESYEARDAQSAVSVRIGEYANFALGDSAKPAHGCGTYVLYLLLPEDEHTYAVELPEIFSAYRFYVGDELLASMGDPSEEGYTPRILSQIVTFKASGAVRLMLAVRDESHAYSGMTYPPAFGEPSAVDAAQNLRTMLSASFVTALLLLAALALWVAVKRYRIPGDSWSFFFMCVCAAAAMSYPILHSTVALGVHPWYTFEIAGRYLLALCVIVMHDRLCKLPKAVRIASATTAGAVCIAATLASAFSAYMTQPAAVFFSAVAFLFKLAVGLHLLATSLYATLRGSDRTEMVFFADLFYAATLIWDIVLPAYEPIIGGWFAEWGGFLPVLAMGVVLWRDVVSGYRRSLTFAEERRQMERQIRMQQEHYRQISDHVEESRRNHHDFRQHLRTIASLAGDSEQQLAYISGITAVTGHGLPPRYSGDSAVDALLYYYVSTAQSLGVEMSVRVEMPSELPVPAIELCTILGNLAENAIEACSRLDPDAQRVVRLHIRWQFEKLYIALENSYDGVVRRSDKRFLSTKHEGDGIGTRSVRELVERLGGSVEFIPEAELFRVEIVLPPQFEQ